MIRVVTKGSQIFVDLFALSTAYWFAFLFRFEFILPLEILKLLFFSWPYVVVFQYLVLVAFGVPRFAWRYVSLRDASTILVSLAVSCAVLTALRLGLAPIGGYTKFVAIPLGVVSIDFVLGVLAVTGVRAARRLLGEKLATDRLRERAIPRVPTILIGAGEAGAMVAKEISNRPDLGIEPVGFLDDDETKVGMVVHGVRVLGTTARALELAAESGAQQALITVANARSPGLRHVVLACEGAGIPAKIIPGLFEIVGGKVNLSRIRPVAIEDLLGREPVKLDLDAISSFIQRKVVMITGAGGSIGSELCRQVSQFGPSRLVLVERFENSLFEIHRELRERFPGMSIEPRIGDITDQARMDLVLQRAKPDALFHAAAHKHVPMMEQNPGEAIKNNVLGTRCIAELAAKHKVGSFVMISTDKAVNPTSVMGASKRVAELLIQGMAQRHRATKFVSVRFGNVLGSSGSVVPIFKRQIADGGPVTVTHPEMKRYFMTIPEATQLVLEAAALGQGGEVFILDMGHPVKIVDLARDLIRLSGLEPDRDIEIRFTGIRPGEKLFEELSTDEEKADKTKHEKIFVGRIQPADWNQLKAGIEALSSDTDHFDERQIYEALRKLIPEFSGRVPAESRAAEPQPTANN